MELLLYCHMPNKGHQFFNLNQHLLFVFILSISSPYFIK